MPGGRETKWPALGYRKCLSGNVLRWAAARRSIKTASAVEGHMASDSPETSSTGAVMFSTGISAPSYRAGSFRTGVNQSTKAIGPLPVGGRLRPGEGGTYGSGRPRNVHAGPSTGPDRSRPDQLMPLGEYATVGPTMSSSDAAHSASSLPRDAVISPTRSPRISSRSNNHLAASWTVSIGMLLNVGGNPGPAKYPTARVAIPCAASSGAHIAAGPSPPPDPPKATAPGNGPTPAGRAYTPHTPRSDTGVTVEPGRSHDRSNRTTVLAAPSDTWIRQGTGAGPGGAVVA